MIDWIRKRIIIEKNAEWRPKKEGRRGDGLRGYRRERAREGETRKGLRGGMLPGEKEGEGARTIGNNISIPIEATHTNAMVRRVGGGRLRVRGGGQGCRLSRDEEGLRQEEGTRPLRKE